MNFAKFRVPLISRGNLQNLEILKFDKIFVKFDIKISKKNNKSMQNEIT